MTPSPVNWFREPSYRCTTSEHRSTSSDISSRMRSEPTAAAMSIEWTTSANSTVTCLYSATLPTGAMAAPHSSQNFASPRSSLLQAGQATPIVPEYETNPARAREYCRTSEICAERALTPDDLFNRGKCQVPAAGQRTDSEHTSWSAILAGWACGCARSSPC